jgi:hypothetical protein
MTFVHTGTGDNKRQQATTSDNKSLHHIAPRNVIEYKLPGRAKGGLLVHRLFLCPFFVFFKRSQISGAAGAYLLHSTGVASHNVRGVVTGRLGVFRKRALNVG